jgi:hypothetical protein
VSVPQHQWATFVCKEHPLTPANICANCPSGNSRRPELVQINRVDVYLFRADSREQVLVMRDLPNPSNQAGVVTAMVDDRWFGSQGEGWDGERVSYPFYWVIQRSDRELNGDELPQSTFSAVRESLLLPSAAFRPLMNSVQKQHTWILWPHQCRPHQQWRHHLHQLVRLPCHPHPKHH